MSYYLHKKSRLQSHCLHFPPALVMDLLPYEVYGRSEPIVANEEPREENEDCVVKSGWKEVFLTPIKTNKDCVNTTNVV